MVLRALSTALALAAWAGRCAAQTDTSERFYTPKTGDDQWVPVTEGNVGGPPKGTNVVERFTVGISVKPDATQGVAVNADLGSAAWAGHTQVTLSITWQDPTNAPWKDMDFLLSSKNCSDPAVKTPEEIRHPDGVFSYKWPFAPFAEVDAQPKVKKQMTLHMYKNTVATLAEARCAVIVNVATNKVLGAAYIHPAKLKIPERFHSAISVSIREKAYSFVMYEAMDYQCNAVVQEYFSSTWGHTRLLFNFGNKNSRARLWRMHAPNATWTKGLCVSQEMEAEVPYENIDGTHVATSRHFLGLRDQTTFQPGNNNASNMVRGVPSDVYSFDFDITRNAQQFSAGYESFFYFSKPIWHIADAFGTRALRRIVLKGTANSGNSSKTVDHVYDYLDFQPRIPDSVTFEPAFMLPGGQGCDELNLGCAVDEGRKDDTARRKAATMVTERVQIDVDRAATCKTDAFVAESAHNATVGATAAVTVVLTALIVAATTIFCFKRRRDHSVSAAMYAHSSSDRTLDS